MSFFLPKKIRGPTRGQGHISGRVIEGVTDFPTGILPKDLSWRMIDLAEDGPHLLTWALYNRTGGYDEQLLSVPTQPFSAYLRIRPNDKYGTITNEHRVAFGHGRQCMINSGGGLQVDLVLPAQTIPDNTLEPFRLPRYAVWASQICGGNGGIEPFETESAKLTIANGSSVILSIPPRVRCFWISTRTASTSWTAFGQYVDGAGAYQELNRWTGAAIIRQAMRVPNEAARLVITAGANLTDLVCTFAPEVARLG